MVDIPHPMRTGADFVRQRLRLFSMWQLLTDVSIPPDEQSEWQSDEQDMFQHDLDEEPYGRSGQRRRSAERQNDKVHDNKNAKSVQERARNDMLAQERNSVGAKDKNAGHNSGHDEVKDQPEQGSGESPFEGGVSHCSACHLLQHGNKGIVFKDAKYEPRLDDQMECAGNQSADHT